MARNNLIDKLEFKPDLCHMRRNIPLNMLTEDMMRMVMESERNDIKDTLLKIKIDESFDKNVKNLSGVDVPILKDVVTHLRSTENREKYSVNIDDFLKSGLIVELLQLLARMLMYKCDGCQTRINYINGMRSHTCVRCDKMACPQCDKDLNMDQNYICRKYTDECRNLKEFQIHISN